MLTEQDLRRELTGGKVRSLYLIYGEEKYLVRKCTELLLNKAAGKTPSDFDLIRLNADSTLEDIIAASDQLPVMSERKCVVVSDWNMDALPERDFKTLLEFCQDLAPETVLIFTMPLLVPDEKKNTKFKKFLTAADHNGAVLSLRKMKDAELERQLVAWAEKGGCTLSRINASKILSLSGSDLLNLRNEMDKLIAYAHGGEITDEMIRRLVVRNTEVRIFSLSDSIARNDFDTAFLQLHGLFEQNEKPEVILSVLSSVYLDMYRMRTALESGKSVSEVAADFKYGKREFLLKNAASNAKRFSTAVLREFLDIILEADIQLKSKPVDRQILLETLIARLMLAAAHS